MTKTVEEIKAASETITKKEIVFVEIGNLKKGVMAWAVSIFGSARGVL